MKKTKFRMQMGSFDLIKGLAMIGVIAWHTFPFGKLGSVNVPMVIKYPLVAFASIIISSLMPAFLIMTGYGFRANNTIAKLKKQVGYYLKPYCIAGCATVIVHLLAHYTAFRYFKGSVIETIKVAIGIILALPAGMEIKGNWIFASGAIWFLMASAIGWVTLAVCFKVKKRQMIPILVLMLVTIGWIISYNRVLFFCVSQGLISSGFFYLGYLARERKYLIEKPSVTSCIILAVSVVINIVGLATYQSFENMAENVWFFGPVSILADGVIGIALLHILLRVSNSSNIVSRLVKAIGRNSLQVLCVHSVGVIALPWYILREKSSLNDFQNSLIIFILRSILIFIVVLLIKKIKKFFSNLGIKTK